MALFKKAVRLIAPGAGGGAQGTKNNRFTTKLRENKRVNRADPPHAPHPSSLNEQKLFHEFLNFTVRFEHKQKQKTFVQCFRVRGAHS